MAADWNEVTKRILDALDIAAEYRALGLEIAGRSPRPSGWLDCRCYGRSSDNPDNRPSAGINVGPDHPRRGRYKEFTGEGRNLSLFEFAVVAGKFSDWKEARKHYAKQAGIKLPSAKGQKAPEDKLAFRDWNEALVKAWCLHKPPIAAAAVKMAGGRLASWPASTKQFTVVSLPAFGIHGTNDIPTGWVVWNKSGKPLPLYQGKGIPPEPVKMLTVGGSRSGWMNAFGLDHLDTAEIVWKVEGPTDMLALQLAIPEELRERHVVLTNAAGTGEYPFSAGADRTPWDDLIAMLAGKTVYVIHDADYPGQGIDDEGKAIDNGSRRWCRAIVEVAAECRNVQLPYEIAPKHGKDLRDYLTEGLTYQDLLALAEAAEIIPRPAETIHQTAGTIPSPISPDSPAAPEASAAVQGSGAADPIAHDRSICEAIKIDVLGELPDGKIKIFSEVYGKNVTIDKIHYLNYPEMLQRFGPVVREKVHRGRDEVPGMYHIDRVKEAIAVVAGSERAGRGVELGQGVWLGETGLNGDPQVILVGSGKAAVWDGEKLAILCKPRVAGEKVDLDVPADEQWFDLNRLAGYLEQAGDLHWVGEVTDEVIQIFERWCWKNDTGVTAEIMTGLVLATWVQSIWSWRPLVSITGPSDCGKTTLFETLESLFGQLALLNSKSTEAGIRQAVGCHSKVILCDEFESDKHRKQILEFFRTSSKGSKTLRGTTQQSSREYGLRHICWAAAVEIGLARAPDRNRFILLELESIPKDRRGKIALPPEPHLEDLGQKLLAIAVRYAWQAEKLSLLLKGHTFEGVHGRVVESFSVPVAMLAAVTGMSEETAATGLMQEIFSKLEQDPAQATKDEVDLLGDILSSTVDMGRGDRLTVAQVLSDPEASKAALDALERVGIAVVCGRGVSVREVFSATGLFIAQKAVLRYLLKGTQWEDQSIDQILKRLPGARKHQASVGGHRPWGVLIPWALIKDRYLSPAQETQQTF
jgi:hypothetical protein